jgi:hypothetical protein
MILSGTVPTGVPVPWILSGAVLLARSFPTLHGRAQEVWGRIPAARVARSR